MIGRGFGVGVAPGRYERLQEAGVPKHGGPEEGRRERSERKKGFKTEGWTDR